MTKKIILQIDGGGILGITPAIVLDELEKQIRTKTGKQGFLLRDSLALCCGTSTGAIMAGLVVAGVDAANIRQFYSVDGVNLFNNSKNPFYTRMLYPKFDRATFIEKLDEILKNNSSYQKANVTLGELADSTMFMATAYNLSSHRTHFIKSHDEHDKPLQLKDVIAWSALSAAYYFGKINVPDYKWKFMDNGAFTSEETPKHRYEIGAVFQDGGQGTQNCTLDFVLTEILRCGWCGDNDYVIIISLGTGGRTKFNKYDDAKDITDISQAFKFIAGQARNESTVLQKFAALYVARKRKNIRLFRLDYESSEDYSLDDTSHITVYQKGANDIINSSTFDNLLKSVVAIVTEMKV